MIKTMLPRWDAASGMGTRSQMGILGLPQQAATLFPPHILLHFVTHSWHWQEFPKYQQSIDFSILSSAFPLSKGQCIPRELRQQLNPGQGQSALLPLLILPLSSPLCHSMPFLRAGLPLSSVLAKGSSAWHGSSAPLTYNELC